MHIGNDAHCKNALWAKVYSTKSNRKQWIKLNYEIKLYFLMVTIHAEQANFDSVGPHYLMQNKCTRKSHIETCVGESQTISVFSFMVWLVLLLSTKSQLDPVSNLLPHNWVILFLPCVLLLHCWSSFLATRSSSFSSGSSIFSAGFSFFFTSFYSKVSKVIRK